MQDGRMVIVPFFSVFLIWWPCDVTGHIPLSTVDMRSSGHLTKLLPRSFTRGNSIRKYSNTTWKHSNITWQKIPRAIGYGSIIPPHGVQKTFGKPVLQKYYSTQVSPHSNNISLADLHGPFWPTHHSQLQPAEKNWAAKVWQSPLSLIILAPASGTHLSF